MSDRRQRREVMRSRARRYRKARSFRYTRTPFDPPTGKFFSLIPQEVAAASAFSASAVQEFLITEEHDDCLKGILQVDGSEHFIAKPYIMRRTTYDGKTTASGVTYTYQSVTSRHAQRGARQEFHRIIPAYLELENELILAIPAEISVGGNITCTWQDVNAAGRCWAVGSAS